MLQAKPRQRGVLRMELHGIRTAANDVSARGFGILFFEKLEEVPRIGKRRALGPFHLDGRHDVVRFDDEVHLGTVLGAQEALVF